MQENAEKCKKMQENAKSVLGRICKAGPSSPSPFTLPPQRPPSGRPFGVALFAFGSTAEKTIHAKKNVGSLPTFHF
jgi:hypothetical protein